MGFLLTEYQGLGPGRAEGGVERETATAGATVNRGAGEEAAS